MAQHGSVLFEENLRSYLDDEIGTDPEDVRVKGRVMKLAEGETVGHDWQTERMAVGEDVRRVEEPGVLEVADTARP